MKYKILQEEKVYNGFLTIKKGTIQHDSFYDKAAITIEREFISKGDAVAIVIFEKDTNSILMVKQFRYPTTENKEGWLLEIPAGMMEPNEDAVTCVAREVKEELGYDVSDVKEIAIFYTSPGCLSERIILFYAEVTSDHKTAAGGGLAEEKEDIKLVKIPVADLKKKLSNCEIQDAKSLIGIQWYLLNCQSF